MSLILHQQVHGLQKSGSSTTHPSKSSANAKEEKKNLISNSDRALQTVHTSLNQDSLYSVYLQNVFCLQLVVHAVELNLDRLLIISDLICIHLPYKIHKTTSSILSNAKSFS